MEGSEPPVGSGQGRRRGRRPHRVLAVSLEGGYAAVLLGHETGGEQDVRAEQGRSVVAFIHELLPTSEIPGNSVGIRRAGV